MTASLHGSPSSPGPESRSNNGNSKRNDEYRNDVEYVKRDAYGRVSLSSPSFKERKKML